MRRSASIVVTIGAVLMPMAVPMAVVAQPAISVVDDVCTSATLDYGERNTALSDAGWTAGIPDDLRSDWAVSLTSVDALVMLAMRPGPELDALVAQSARRFAPLEGLDSTFWHWNDATAIIRIVQTNFDDARRIIGCEYTGLATAGGVDAVAATSRFADDFTMQDVFPIAALSGGVDSQALSAARPASGWHPDVVTVKQYTGPRDILAGGASFRFPVQYMSISRFLGAAS